MRKPSLRRLGTALVLAAGLAGMPGSALAHDHESCRSGHPLRVLAYVVHPVGVIVDTVLFRPAHWLVHYEPLRKLFGHDGCC